VTFPPPAGMSLTKLYLGGNNLIYGVLIYLEYHAGSVHSSELAPPPPSTSECDLPPQRRQSAMLFLDSLELGRPSPPQPQSSVPPPPPPVVSTERATLFRERRGPIPTWGHKLHVALNVYMNFVVPPEPKRGRGWGVEGPNSDDWTKSLALCLSCGFMYVKIKLYTRGLPGPAFIKSKNIALLS
jgi:hypothetical protein